MKIRTGLIALLLLGVLGVAMADGMESAGAAGQAAAVAAPERIQARERERMAGPRMKRLPRGDLRYCLDLKTQAAVIRCAESGRRK